MTAVAIVLAAFFFVVLAAWMWRSTWSERRSIDSHEHAMEVLREMSLRREGQSEPQRPARSDQHMRPGAIPDLRPRRDLAERLAEHPPSRPPVTARAQNGEGQSLAENLQAAARLRETGEAASTSGRRRAHASRLGRKPKLVFVADDLRAPEEAPPASPAAAGGGAVVDRATGSSVTEGFLVTGAARLVQDNEQAEGAVAAVAGGLGAEGPGAGDPSAGGPGEDAQWDDAQAVRTPLAVTPVGPASSARARRPHRRGPLLLILAAVVIAAAVVPAAVLSGASSTNHATRSATPRTATGTHGSAPPPSPTQITPVRSDENGAVYQLTSANYELAISANGPCWIDVLQGQGGPQIFEGTLAAGDVRTISAKGAVWVRVGDAAHMSATIDDIPVVMPGATGAPYDLSFVPA